MKKFKIYDRSEISVLEGNTVLTTHHVNEKTQKNPDQLIYFSPAESLIILIIALRIVLTQLEGRSFQVWIILWIVSDFIGIQPWIIQLGTVKLKD